MIFCHKKICFVEKIKKAESDFWDITFLPLINTLIYIQIIIYICLHKFKNMTKCFT